MSPVFDYEAMVSPLFRWPNLVCHYSLMKYARIDNSEVMELFQTDGDIKEMFHPELEWIDVTKESPTPKQGGDL